MTDYKPIKAFNSQFDFEKEFKKDANGIFTLLDDVHKNPAKYNVPEAHRPHLKPLYDAIAGLRFPTGGHYVEPIPAIQILRSADQVAPNGPYPWIHNDKSKLFFTIYDLLGIFLTLIGPAPQEAKKKNYFLPLLAVYARWCIEISPDRGSAYAPNTAQVTWATSNGVTYPFLGASAKGFKPVLDDADPAKKNKKRKGEQWRKRVQTTRHGYLKHMLESQYQEFGKVNLPEDEDGNKAEWPFGNCAETYPFLYILDTINPSDSAPKEISEGFALEVGSTYEKSAYNGSEYWEERIIKPPCPNCKYLIKRYKIAVANYIPNDLKK